MKNEGLQQLEKIFPSVVVAWLGLVAISHAKIKLFSWERVDKAMRWHNIQSKRTLKL